jgi:signal transduction histidine kinase
MIILRVFSLTLVVVFGYYLYRREQEITLKTVEINEKLDSALQELERKTEALTRANEKLKRLDRMKSEFVATVSHELRTPLTAIKNSINLIRKSSQDKFERERKTAELIEIISSNTDRQTRLINNLLDLARIEAGTFDTNRDLVSIKDIALKVTRSLQPEADDKNISLSLNCPENIPDIWASSDQIERLFINLISNGIKFTPSGGKVTVTISERPQTVVVEVADTGIGIAKEDLDKIFDKFLQVRDITKPISGGIGLGLSIAKEIVSSHKGSIWVESEVGKGSRFFFELPKDLRKK